MSNQHIFLFISSRSDWNDAQHPSGSQSSAAARLVRLRHSVDGWQENGTAAFRRVATEMKKNDEYQVVSKLAGNSLSEIRVVRYAQMMQSCSFCVIISRVFC